MPLHSGSSASRNKTSTGSFARPVIHYTDLSLEIYHVVYFLGMYPIIRIFKMKFLLGKF